MNNELFRKKVYYCNDSDYMYIIVTQENNGFFVWVYTDNDTNLLNYSLFDKNSMIEYAVDISRKPKEEIIKSILK